MAQRDLQPYIDLADRIADACRPILRRNYRRKIDITVKADSSPVTEADREAERAARQLIARELPEHGIYGEEFGPERADAEHVWIIDPLDGTRAFVTGRPTFGTVIALLEKGSPILGLIDMPVLGDRWLGTVGSATTLNGEPVRARRCPELGAAYLSTTSPAMFDTPDKLAGFEALRSRVRSTTYGGDCYQYGMVATGFLDLVVECGLVEYDYLGLAPIVEGAGGVITDWRGAKLRMGSGDRVIAGGDPELHRQALSLLSA
jgi:inositol-phosphate phosphatase/L-galactose 1-phosphate phosphatase/histidinol-phosphatase